MTPRHTRVIVAAAIVVIAAFGLVNLIGLDRFPLVFDDEPWIAEPGYRFWERGRFMSELMAGLFGTDRYYMLHAPLYSIVSGGIVWFVGFGLLPLRLLSLGLAVATAAMTWRLGERLLSPLHGLVAVVTLTFWRLTPALDERPAGVPLVDLGRLARYDIAEPALALAAYLLMLPWLLSLPGAAHAVRWRRTRFVLAGICAGLALDCHPMGLIAITTLAATCLVAARTRAMQATGLTAGLREALPAIGWIALGTTIAVLPYLWFGYIARAELVAQQQYVSGRYDILNPSVLVESLREEWHRYGTIGRGALAGQPAALLFLLCGAGGLFAMLFGTQRHDRRVALVRAGLLTGVVLFAIGVRPKFYFYLAVLWPWMALTGAIGLVAAFQSTSRLLRYGAIALTVLACGDGIVSSVTFSRRALDATRYTDLCNRLIAELPRHAKVLARPHYWLGLKPYVAGYQASTVPVVLSYEKFDDPHGPHMTERLAAIAPDVVIVDRNLRGFLDNANDPSTAGTPHGRGARELRDYLETQADLLSVLTDPSYGRFEIYRVRR